LYSFFFKSYLPQTSDVQYMFMYLQPLSTTTTDIFHSFYFYTQHFA